MATNELPSPYERTQPPAYRNGGGFTWKSIFRALFGSCGCVGDSNDNDDTLSNSSGEMEAGKVRMSATAVRRGIPIEVNSTTLMYGERAQETVVEKDSFRTRLRRCCKRKKRKKTAAESIAGLDINGRTININESQTTTFTSNITTTAKYTLLTFLPIFLYEQFRRYSNLFFLFTAILQQIPGVSPTGRYITLFPLLFILMVSAIKEIIEDIKRHNADKESNRREVDILKDGTWITIKWAELCVGDIVRITNNNYFPADLVLLASSKPEGMCFIKTANLDGETNLKVKYASPDTQFLTDTDELSKLTGFIECEPPNRKIYDFLGVLVVNNLPPIALGPNQFLQRGAALSHTEWIHGIVVYSGHDTKLMRNYARAPLKNSSVDRLMNKQILSLFVFYIILVIASASSHVLWKYKNYTRHTYLAIKDAFEFKDTVYSFLTFLILYNNLIPISLQVTLEVVRLCQAAFMNSDVNMYYEKTDTCAMARTSNLNEELGIVKYVLTDKTGTLTCNIMEFKMCSIAGITYEVADTPEQSELVANLREGHSTAPIIEEFMLAITLCHSVITEEKEDGSVVYHATNPDDQAIIEGAARYGYKFVRRSGNTIDIECLGEIRSYELLQEIEFSSERKRMSVLVRMPEGNIKLYCKGADSVIFDRLAEMEEYPPYYDITKDHLTSLASIGYRTLCCAVANISEEQYNDWIGLYRAASASLRNREENIERTADTIEQNLTLLGITAIEDKLQDGVPDTIASLLAADIRIWMLTGDKQETAINIGFSSGLLHHTMRLILLNENSLRGTFSALRSNLMSGKLNNVGLVIDGKTLQFALSSKLRSIFNEICMKCRVVICCRLSPVQKGEITELVNSNGVCTLAIGDGANDVTMIRKAHVGVGISGTEGLQAACASDYSIAQFRFLKRLLFVHGTLNFRRITTLILYAFYKNICMSIIQMWYCIYNGWSAQVLFESWSIAGYNVLFTVMPPLAIGIFDKVCSIKLLLRFPQIYRRAHDAKLFNVGIFWIWIINAFVHSMIIFFIPMSLLSTVDIIWTHGRSSELWVIGTIVYTAVVITVCLKAGLCMHSWTIISHVAIWGSIFLWFLWIIIYSYFWPVIHIGPQFSRLNEQLFTSFVYWLLIILTPAIALLPDFFIKVFCNTYLVTVTEIARKIAQKKEKKTKKQKEVKR